MDGGHLLHVVVWPTDATYQDVCEAYVTYALRHYNNDSIVVFDGYEGLPSTKNAERQRRAKQPTSPDILFKYNMKTTTSQKSFLQNQKNKSRLITYLTPELQKCDIQVKQHHADADPLVIKTVLSTASVSDRPIVVVATDTDILVMLVTLAPTDLNIQFLSSRNPMQIFKITDIQTANKDIKPHLMTMHALSGCDTVSALYMKGKKKATQLLHKKKWDILNIFLQPGSTHEDIAFAGERFLLGLYGAVESTCLNKQRFVMYKRMVLQSPLSSAFKLESLPPTSTAAKFHSFRAYHTIQQWLGNELPPDLWGWQNRDATLVTVVTDQSVAPMNILRMLSCGCKTGCGRSCGCRKRGLQCSVICSHCSRMTCSNILIDTNLEV